MRKRGKKKERRKQYGIEILRRKGVFVKILKNLYYKKENYGSRIIRETALASSTNQLHLMLSNKYIQIIPHRRCDVRRKYYILTKKGNELITEFILMERKLYGDVKK